MHIKRINLASKLLNPGGTNEIEWWISLLMNSTRQYHSITWKCVIIVTGNQNQGMHILFNHYLWNLAYVCTQECKFLFIICM